MPIKPLPENTVRLLGSATVITTPVSLVKELLENAIDAGATSIDVLVSQNIVDRIEIRDNGDGIHPDDYDFLGRPGHTSKMTSFDELRTIGATTLGFRGQALASANSMGNVTVTTRTLQDPTAVRLELRHGVGGVENQERTSAPVGTTVIVTALFSRLPVRQQVVLRENQKNIANIKNLLHVYALARPQTRLSFKVMGGHFKQSWSYSPRPQAAVKEAVVQLFGTAVMSQCLLQTLATDVGIEGHASSDGPGLVIEAVLPKPDADLSKLSKGPFLSIDSRPITTLRGTGKNLLQIFRTHLKRLRGLDDIPRALNDTFIRVNIKCSPGIYDPNIEPSKDQVIFANESRVIDLFERLCTEAYKAQAARSAFVTIEKRPLIHRTQTRTPPPSSDGPEGDGPEGDEPSTLDSGDPAGGRATQPPQSSTSSYSSPLNSIPLGTDTEPAQQPQRTSRPRDSPLPRPGFQSPLKAGLSGSSNSQDRSGARQTQLVRPSTGNILVRGTEPDHPQLMIRNTHNEQAVTTTNVVPRKCGQNDIPCQPATAPYQSRKRAFVVDMSADPDMSSDEEAEMLASRFRELQNNNSQLDDSSEHSKESLNPWVIATMNASTRQPIARHGISADVSQNLEHGQGPANSPKVSEVSEEELPILRPRGSGGPPGDLDMPRAMRTGRLQMERHEARGFHSLGPSANTAMPQDSSGPSEYKISGLPMQPAESSGRHSLPDLRGYCKDVGDNVDPSGLVQSKLPSGEPTATYKKYQNQPQMHINDVPARLKPPFRKPRRLNARSRRLSAGKGIQPSGSPGDSGMNKRRSSEHSGSSVRANDLIQYSQKSSRAPFRSPESHLAQYPYTHNSNAGNAEHEHVDGEDPREYLIKRQRSEAGDRGRARQTIQRTRTDRLPLETIPQGHEIQHLVLVVKADTKDLDQTQTGGTEEAAGENGSLCAGMDLEDAAEIEARLKHILSAWAE
ncbi:hypothetical protein VSDG_04556 [Cytospora chrysosperma]|uniref:DNA mismatch repair protein S5 domain-containing protein n=1 Tax=Cytospora chrysosperma TaxID=252740 RepID=A0A423W2Q3_CYTCH|nr:hypothetical protein VSDG_04556 [Valsa sordida]